MFRFGVDYHSEHWPEDTRLMSEDGINIVCLVEFAWSFLEPQPGCFDFDWLDRAIAILPEHGILIFKQFSRWV